MEKGITIEDLKKNWSDWKIESPEQEQKAIELVTKAMKHLQVHCHPDPIQD